MCTVFNSNVATKPVLLHTPGSSDIIHKIGALLSSSLLTDITGYCSRNLSTKIQCKLKKCTTKCFHIIIMINLPHTFNVQISTIHSLKF